MKMDRRSFLTMTGAALAAAHGHADGDEEKEALDKELERYQEKKPCRELLKNGEPVDLDKQEPPKDPLARRIWEKINRQRTPVDPVLGEFY